VTGTGESPESPSPAPRSTEFIGFELGTTRYAVAVTQVRELMPVPVITEVPRAPAEIAGVMLAAGSVITIIDLARLLGVPSAARGERSRVILVQGAGELLGFLVSKTLGVYELRGDQIEPLAQSGESEPALLRPWGKGRPSQTASDALLLLDLASWR
jgi:purine-binding chemotaxis protein CheW